MGEDNRQYLPSEDVKRILARFDSVDSGLATLDTRLMTLDSGLATFDTRLTTLEEKVDRRLQETRPIWEQVLTRLDSLDTRMDSLDIRMASLESAMSAGFRKVERQIGELAKDVIIVRADQRDLEKRMDKLESEPTR